MARLDYLPLSDGRYLLVLDQLSAEEAQRLRRETIALVDKYLQERDANCIGLLVFNISVDIGINE
jgi:hypothetical protein